MKSPARNFLSLFALFLTVFFSFSAQPAETNLVLQVDIAEAVSPASAELLDEAISVAEEMDASLLIIRLNTPGGLGKSMRDMVSAILNSTVPIATWVTPSGARAASAGVFIVAAADIAVMSPQTTIGAASPVGMGGKDIDGTMAEKVKNDILSLIRGVAKSRGRNVEWYERAVTEADSITATEAAMKNVIDFIATDTDDLLQQISARDIGISLDTKTTEIRFHEPGIRHKLLSWLLDPQIAYILLLGGMAGLFFELATPGTILPGVLGGISLLLGLYAMAILPTNVAGLLLILLGLVLFILEIKVVSFGMLSVAGLACFFIGSLILYDFEYGFVGLPLSTVTGVSLGLAVVVGTAVYLVIRAHRKRPHQGLQALIGDTAIIRTWEGEYGQIMVRGEIWRAYSDTSLNLVEGDSVKIIQASGLKLQISEISDSSESDPISSRSSTAE